MRTFPAVHPSERRRSLPMKLADRPRTDALQMCRSRCARVPLALIQTTRVLLPPGCYRWVSDAQSLIVLAHVLNE
jgi:hypothetical protein